MTIDDICSHRIVTVGIDATLVEAASLMREHHVGALVVVTPVDGGARVEGVVTDRDLVVDVLARGLDAASVSVGDLTRAPVVSVPDTADLDDAIALMQDGSVRRLLVTNAEQQLCGIVSLDDLIHACATQWSGLSQVLHNGLAREVADRAPLALPSLQVPSMGTAAWGRAVA
jgi:CBS domain-containing protein